MGCACGCDRRTLSLVSDPPSGASAEARIAASADHPRNPSTTVHTGLAASSGVREFAGARHRIDRITPDRPNAGTQSTGLRIMMQIFNNHLPGIRDFDHVS